MTKMTVYELATIGDRAFAAKKEVIDILVQARLTPVVAVGLLEDIKLCVSMDGGT